MFYFKFTLLRCILSKSQKSNSVLDVTKSNKNLQRAIRCGLFFRPLGQDLHQKKKRSKVGLFNRLSQCQFANGFSQEKEKMFLAFAVWLWDITTASIQADYCKYRFPWLCSILKICEVSKLSFNVIVAPTNISMYKKVRFRLFRSGRPFIRSSPLSK